MKDERTETWNPYTMPDRTQTPDWQPAPEAPTPQGEPGRFAPRGSWIDPVAAVVRPR
jgi:hypothetical protein